MKQWIWVSPILVATVLAALSGCGKQSFGVVQTQQDSGAPGSSSIPPKVDILLVVDNTGSELAVQGNLNAAIGTFLSQLNNENWDFRVAAVPLTGTPVISQISASKYDANSANWVAPYPGAPQTSTIPHSMYVPPASYQVTVNAGQTTGDEPGLTNIGTALATSNAQQYFIRPEATLAVVVISNGEDDSDGVDYSAYPYLPYSTISSGVLNGIKNAKGAALAGSIRLIPVVSPSGSRSCSALGGGTAWAATRYISAAAQVGNGTPIDICANSMTAVLSQIQSQVSAVQFNYVSHYVQIASAPNVSTITVTETRSDGSIITVPASVNGSDGWAYIGDVSAPMISSPIVTDYKTGYMIELIGDEYALSGSESASILYTPAGVTPSN